MKTLFSIRKTLIRLTRSIIDAGGIRLAELVKIRR
jgi:hypothetical protein